MVSESSSSYFQLGETIAGSLHLRVQSKGRKATRQVCGRQGCPIAAPKPGSSPTQREEGQGQAGTRRVHFPAPTHSGCSGMGLVSWIPLSSPLMAFSSRLTSTPHTALPSNPPFCPSHSSPVLSAFTFPNSEEIQASKRCGFLAASVKQRGGSTSASC